jgi:hypothetical protein
VDGGLLLYGGCVWVFFPQILVLSFFFLFLLFCVCLVVRMVLRHGLRGKHINHVCGELGG